MKITDTEINQFCNDDKDVSTSKGKSPKSKGKSRATDSEHTINYFIDLLPHTGDQVDQGTSSSNGNSDSDSELDIDEEVFQQHLGDAGLKSESTAMTNQDLLFVHYLPLLFGHLLTTLIAQESSRYSTAQTPPSSSPLLTPSSTP